MSLLSPPVTSLTRIPSRAFSLFPDSIDVRGIDEVPLLSLSESSRSEPSADAAVETRSSADFVDAAAAETGFADGRWSPAVTAAASGAPGVGSLTVAVGAGGGAGGGAGASAT